MNTLYLIEQLFYGHHLSDKELRDARDLLDYLNRELKRREKKD